MKFTAEIFTGGGNTAGFWVPDEVVASFNKGKRVPVVVTINGYSYRNTIASYEGKSAIGVSMENREKAGVKVGDVVEIDLQYDDKPREIEVPDDLRQELNKDPKAKGIFENLSYSHRKEYVRWIQDTKNPETRARRVTKTLIMLKEK